jgi:hypothetical protein
MNTTACVAAIVLSALTGYAQRPPAGGPYRHRVLSASSKDGLTWTRDEGVRLEHASVPAALATDDRIFLYYVDANRGPGQMESVGCATSTDGLRFEKQSLTIEGMTARKALDPSVLRDSEGRFRLYYLAGHAPGDPAAEPGDHEIHLALSDDGIRFRNAGSAFAYPSLVDPDVFLFKEHWFMYVFGGRRGTLIATSNDGQRFEYRQPLDLNGWGTVAPVHLADGRLRLYAFDQRRQLGNSVRSFLSANGIDWTAEPGDRMVAREQEQITDPFVVRWRDGYKMYFKVDERTNQAAGPWDHDLLVHRISPEGAVESVTSFPRAGVPTVTRMHDGRMIAAHQHFPENDTANFDKVAIRFSSDEGRTWTPPQVLQLSGLPEGMRFPFDPTLVPLDDGRLRLYFTSVRAGRQEEVVPGIYSAISTDGLHYTVEPGMRFGVSGRPVIDCAVAVHDGVFHLYSPDNNAQGSSGGGQAGLGYHATSKDGLNFVRADDVRIEGERRWLGNVVADGAGLTFVGTGGPRAGGMWFARSTDGRSWKLLDPVRVPGADPGAVKTKDGGWIVISTGPPRPGTPSAQRTR